MRGYFNRSYIEGYFTGKHKGNHTGRQIWTLVVFEIWHRLYIDGMANDKKVPYAISVM
ncbi:asparagine synthase (glutamine-hydrolysing) [Caldanaerobius fijiensis DSM 17918]|uniref:Asparagine synthase (Glutamine-hydrolysing) n=2 Tax=Caldanaerobius TaxID=862261 RepID=A0A1M5CMH9_9THEO|nr:asparagine synthase (glutamine-hydrolysing) [Caldanaerobius fijiensis DSM 17918]